jgi:hypothetical protein
MGIDWTAEDMVANDPALQKIANNLRHGYY